MHIGGNEARNLMKLPMSLKLYNTDTTDSSDSKSLGVFSVDLLQLLWGGDAVNGSGQEKTVQLSTSLREMVASADSDGGAVDLPWDARISLTVMWRPAQLNG